MDDRRAAEDATTGDPRTPDHTSSETDPEPPASTGGTTDPVRTMVLKELPPLPFVFHTHEGVVKLLAAVIGIVGGYLCSRWIAGAYPKDSILGRTFDFDTMTVVIPVSIACFFVWGLLLSGWNALRVLGLQRACGQRALLIVIRSLSKTDVATLERELKAIGTDRHPLLRRLLAVTQQWLLKPGLQDADIVLQQHVANDDEHVHGAYSLVRTFIWALPVLGLIGTVIGISLAVGGFADFLGGNIEEVAAIKKNLVGVTSGLSFAFLITLFGLVASLILMLAASVLQTRETALYSTMQRNIADQFLPAIQRAAPEQLEQRFTPDLTLWQQALQGMVDGFLREIAAKSGRVIETLDARQTTYQAHVADWAATLRRETEAGAKSLGSALVGLESILLNFPEKATSQLAPRLETVSEELSHLSRTLDSTNQLHAQHQTALQSVLVEQSQTVSEFRTALASLSDTTQLMIESRTALLQDLNAFVNGSAATAIRETNGALARQTEETKESAKVAAQLCAQVEAVLKAQRVLHDAVLQLQQSGMTESLGNFHKGMEDLLPILQSFRGPFVLQAVPAPGHSQGQSAGTGSAG